MWHPADAKTFEYSDISSGIFEARMNPDVAPATRKQAVFVPAFNSRTWDSWTSASFF